MTEPSEAAKAWAAVCKFDGMGKPLQESIRGLVAVAFDAGRASAPLPTKVLEAVREYETEANELPENPDPSQVEGVHWRYIAIADAVLAHLKGEGQ